MLFLWVEFMATLLLVVTNAGSSSGPGNCNLFLAARFGPLLRFFLLRSVAQGSLLLALPNAPSFFYGCCSALIIPGFLPQRVEIEEWPLERDV